MIFKNLFYSFIKSFSFFKSYEYDTRLIENNPQKEDVASKSIFIVGGPRFQKWAYFKCPCGCDEIIMLSLSKDRRPSWSVKVDFWGRPSIHPSVHQLSGCKSHFWVKKGNISWCLDSKPSHMNTIV